MPYIPICQPNAPIINIIQPILMIVNLMVAKVIIEFYVRWVHSNFVTVINSK